VLEVVDFNEVIRAAFGTSNNGCAVENELHPLSARLRRINRGLGGGERVLTGCNFNGFHFFFLLFGLGLVALSRAAADLAADLALPPFLPIFERYCLMFTTPPRRTLHTDTKIYFLMHLARILLVHVCTLLSSHVL
jgi:hypothetical protein